jgi:hypothetical protein
VTATLGHDGGLFNCHAGTFTLATNCPGGCHVNATGPDMCNAAPTTCGCWAGDCSSCYCGTAVSTYASSHGCNVPASIGHTGDLLGCHAGTWTVDNTCAYGCGIASSGPDYCRSMPGASHNLWIAFENGHQMWQSNVIAFFNCLFDHTNFNDLASAYPAGRRLSFGGSAVVGLCGYSDWQCVEDSAHFDMHDGDVLLYEHSGGCGGFNRWNQVVTTPSGRVTINGANTGDGGGRLACQTAMGMHETYEAAGDSAAADCCNGQVPGSFNPNAPDFCWNWCGSCSGSCRMFGPTSCGGNAVEGWYSLSCGGTSYTAVRVSPVTDEFAPSGCMTLATH